jgi:hypothetical protein
MTVTIPNKTEFVATFLNPLSRVNEACVIKITKTGASCLTNAPDGTLILHCTYPLDIDTQNDVILNVPDIGRLIKILNCIEDEAISLDVTSNCINYKSTNIRFKYHLLEDDIISSPAINIDKLKAIEYNTAFKLQQESLINLIKSSAFASDTNKIYFYTKDDNVYGELTDHDRHNCDSVTQCISQKFTGDRISTPIPVPFDTIRIIANNRSESLNVLVNLALSVLIFDVNINNIKNKYVVTGLVQTA